MLKKLTKIMGSLILALTMLFSLSNAAMADAGVPDLKEKGSISITPRPTDGSESVIPGMSFTMYYVAHITTDAKNNLVYEFENNFAGCKVDLKDLSAAGLSESLANFVWGHSLTGTEEGKDDDNDGTIKFDDLPLGLYLLIQNNTGTGYTVSPFLVSVPGKDEENDSWVYDVDCQSKAEAVKIPTNTPTPTPAEPTPTETPAPTPSEPTPTPAEPTPTVTPEVVPSTTPEPSPEVTPSTTPEVTPSTTPEVTPSVTPEPDISVTPSPSVSETPTPTPTETEVTPTPTPSGGSDSNPTPTPTEKLVQTGQLNWPIPVLAAAGILLFGIGWALKNLNKREK